MKIKELFKKKPLGLKIIIIIYLFASILYLVIGILSITSQNLISQIPDFNTTALPNGQVFLIISILFIILSIFVFFIVLGLLKNQQWSRISLIVINILNIIGGIISLTNGDFLSLINLTFNLVIAIYLIFNKKVKKIYKN